jgi:hypothetical protein
MAFDPAMQAPPAPAGAPPADAAPADQGGFCIELYVTGDGKMSVAVEPGKAEAAEGAEGGEPASQPVGSIQEAFKLIRDIVEHGGQQVDAGASQDAMSSGYGQGGM